EQNDLRIRNGTPLASSRRIRVEDDRERWFELSAREEIRLADLDVILMRKDPPFDTEYIYTTYILERAEAAGVLVINRPASLRDINEKAFTAWFPQCCPDTLITRSMADMRAFLGEHGHIVVKPLHGMGGRSIFVVKQGDRNANVIFETLTEFDTRHAIAQRYLPEIRQGDKRIILVDGKPAGAVSRMPQDGEARANFHAGGSAKQADLTAREEEICAKIGPELSKRGLVFVGIDVIGDFLTEINVTSPTGIQEINRLSGT
ncbi:MAG: glutathione synthase, partial [Gammaproteobacteria bacterium]|nr:glutathione synthase [Gammaproteobacteria bacterium]